MEVTYNICNCCERIKPSTEGNWHIRFTKYGNVDVWFCKECTDEDGEDETK
jgi:hypothetical protein